MPVETRLSGGRTRTTEGGRAAVDYGRTHVYLGAKNGKYPDCNQMVIAGTDTRMAVDASITSHLIGADFNEVDLMVLSHVHEDHSAGVNLLKGVPLQVPRAELAAIRSWEGMVAACGFEPAFQQQMREMFERDFGYAPRPEATGYDDGQVWDLGGVRVRAIHTPGHTAGHMALMVEDEGLLFLGDIELSSFGPYYGDAGSSLTDFRRSIALVRALPARVWVTGHHKGIYENRDSFLADLDAYEAKIDARDDQLLARLTRRPATLDELTDEGLLYPEWFTAIWMRAVERRVIHRHLELFLTMGAVRFEAETGLYHRA